MRSHSNLFRVSQIDPPIARINNLFISRHALKYTLKILDNSTEIAVLLLYMLFRIIFLLKYARIHFILNVMGAMASIISKQ